MNKITLESIAEKVNRHLDTDVRSKLRKREYVYGRVIYYRIARDLTHHTLEKIGKEVNKDHASVNVGLKNFETMKFYKDNFYATYIEIMNDYKNYVLDKSYTNNPDTYWKNKYFKLKRKVERMLDEKKVSQRD
jgi:hypothetical protein|tara:strand:- start:4669 stop:5067 length:399 start_codon:yes stop_codon:yes gene_type:complete